jgi:hypothetical protein
MQPALTLVQKRALLAAKSNVEKKEETLARVRHIYESVLPTQRTQQMTRQYDAAVSALVKAGYALYSLAEKLGVNSNATNYRTMSRNVISNVIKKLGFGPRLEHKIWLRGLEKEMERARSNFRNFEKGRFHRYINHIGDSHRKKATSPPRQRSPARHAPPPHANNAHRRIHGIGPANTTHITWSRNANGKINIHSTINKLKLMLTSEQRNALSKMPKNQAMETIRILARLG